MGNTEKSFIWEKSFPPVFRHTSISFLKNRQGFYEAKHGNMKAALMTVEECVKPLVTAQIREKYPDAVLMPVITNNRLPLALAETIGLKTCVNVRQVYAAGRKKMSGSERLVHKPEFAGEIEKGKSYVLIDDIITQGGTVSALRRYTLACGGKVCAVVVLACSVGAGDLAPAPTNFFRLVEKFGYVQLTDILSEYGIIDNLWELTDRQVKYLLRFNEISGIEKKLISAAGILSNEKREVEPVIALAGGMSSMTAS